MIVLPCKANLLSIKRPEKPSIGLEVEKAGCARGGQLAKWP